jgi:hypothetical protein
MPTFYFRFKARPKPSNAEAQQTGGAMINCWIVRDTIEQAESQARGAIGDEDWRITELEDSGEVTRDTQLPEGIEYFEQAQIDQRVFVFYRWPIDAPDDDSTSD